MTVYTYIILSFLLGTYLTVMNLLISNRNVKTGSIIVVFAFVFNIIYTGLLGWNLIAASGLEWILDIIDAVIMYYGIYLVNKDLLAIIKKK